jgi:hypothetical protein
MHPNMGNTNPNALSISTSMCSCQPGRAVAVVVDTEHRSEGELDKATVATVILQIINDSSR